MKLSSLHSIFMIKHSSYRQPRMCLISLHDIEESWFCSYLSDFFLTYIVLSLQSSATSLSQHFPNCTLGSFSPPLQSQTNFGFKGWGITTKLNSDCIFICRLHITICDVPTWAKRKTKLNNSPPNAVVLTVSVREINIYQNGQLEASESSPILPPCSHNTTSPFYSYQCSLSRVLASLLLSQ